MLCAVGGLAVLGMAACDTANTTNGQQTMTTSAVVTLDVYSGKPNPSWTLTDSQTQEFVQRVKALQSAAGGAASPDVLGYRAVRVELHDVDGVAVFAFFREAVAVTRTGRETHYSDPGRKTELWVVQTGAGHVGGNLLQQVTAQISGKP